jgi:hypothetical protein|tara:strand:+ start:345 stop:548 length:204 start_codon:yes stop_codon:yes gene_type:complete
MSENIEYYTFTDLEEPGKAFYKLNAKVILLTQLQDKPKTKPEHIFENFKKPKSRCSARIKKQKKTGV